jgi:hypothetical protein
VSTTIIAAQKNSLVELVFDVIDLNGANLTGQAASIVKSLRDPDGAAAETVTIVEQGATGFYKVSFTPTKGGMPPKNYYLRLTEPVGSAERSHQWQIQSYDALPVIAGPTGNLTTLAAVKEQLRITTGGDDTFLTNAIARVSDFIRRHTGRALTQTTLTELHDGKGSPFIVTRDLPIISVTTLHESTDHVFDATTLIAAADYVVDKAAGRIFRKGGLPFTRWPMTVQVVYVAGYTAIPLDIEQIAIDAVSWKYLHRTSSGYISRTYRDASVTRGSASDSGLPADLMTRINLLSALPVFA